MLSIQPWGSYAKRPCVSENLKLAHLTSLTEWKVKWQGFHTDTHTRAREDVSVLHVRHSDGLALAGCSFGDAGNSVHYSTRKCCGQAFSPR